MRALSSPLYQEHSCYLFLFLQEQQPTLTTSTNLNYLLKGSVTKHSHIEGEFWWGNNSVHNRYKTGTLDVHYLEATSISSERVLKSIPVIADAGQLLEKTSSSSSSIVVVQSLSRVWPFVTPWTTARQASLTFTISQSLLRLVYWVSDVIQPSHPLSPFSSCPQSFPASGSFPMNQFFTSGGQSIGASASASVLPMSIQDWFPLGWTGSFSLQSKGLSRVFFSTRVQKYPFFSVQPPLWSNSHIHT